MEDLSKLPTTRKFFALLCKFHSIPYSFDKQNLRLTTRNGIIPKVYWYTFSVLIVWVQLGFLGFRVSESLGKAASIIPGIFKPNELIVQISEFYFTAISAVSQITFIQKMDAIPEFFEHLVSYRIKLTKKGVELKPDFKVAKILLVVALIRNVGLNFISSALRPNKSQFIFSLLPEHLQKKFIVYLGFLGYTLLVRFAAASTLIFFVYVIFIYTATMDVAIKFRIKEPKVTRSRMVDYRVLQLLCDGCNHIYSINNVIYMVVSVAMGTTFAYGCVRFHDKLTPRDFLATLLIPLLLILVLMFHFYPICGQQTILSREDKKKMEWCMRDSYSPTEVKMYLRSFPDFVTRIGFFFHVKKKTMVILINFMAVQVVNLLLYL